MRVCTHNFSGKMLSRIICEIGTKLESRCIIAYKGQYSRRAIRALALWQFGNEVDPTPERAKGRGEFVRFADPPFRRKGNACVKAAFAYKEEGDSLGNQKSSRSKSAPPIARRVIIPLINFFALIIDGGRSGFDNHSRRVRSSNQKTKEFVETTRKTRDLDAPNEPNGESEVS